MLVKVGSKAGSNRLKCGLGSYFLSENKLTRAKVQAIDKKEDSDSAIQESIL